MYVLHSLFMGQCGILDISTGTCKDYQEEEQECSLIFATELKGVPKKDTLFQEFYIHVFFKDRHT